tara:strand:+ start:605 stop:1291 length:687 start_codon:yes stop_codon:yes gene_type:complete
MSFKMKGPSGFKKEWSKNEAGYDVKTTRRKNLFGRERVVEKYYDPETGKKLGKQVTVARGKGDPRADKVKIKKVNPGLTQSGGVGKIRLSQNPWEAPSGKSDPDPNPDTEPKKATDINRAQRAAEIEDKNTTYDKEGNPRIPKYADVFKNFKQDADGKYINPRSGAKYDGLDDFIEDAEAWWAEQAKKTNNEKLKKQNQEYGLDEDGNVKFSKSPNKKRGYIMKKNRK